MSRSPNRLSSHDQPALGRSCALLGAGALWFALAASSMSFQRNAHADAGGTAVLPMPGAGTVTLTNQTPTIVLNGSAALLGPHSPAAPMTFNVVLPLRNQAALQSFVTNEAAHGTYVTQDQFNTLFGVPAQQVHAVQQWGSANHLQATFTAADGTIVSLHGSTAAVAGALHISINDYRSPRGFTFYANNQDATLPAALGAIAVDGLNDIPRFHALNQVARKALFRTAAQKAQTQQTRNRAFNQGFGFWPADFRAAYDVAGHGYDGTGQVIGFTLWGAPVPNSDFINMATATGEPAIVGGSAQNGGTATGTTADHVDWIYTNGIDTTTDAQIETAMDTEYAHGMAPHSHLRYWLGDQVGTCPSCGGSDVGLENAIAMATADPQVHVVSNSWGGGETPSLSDPFYAATNQQFLKAVSVGTTFYFSSGDTGTDSGGTGLPSYPADSPNVVSVGGTSLNLNLNSSYSSESVWADLIFSDGAGAGCSSVIAQPSFQNIAAVNNVATCHLTSSAATRGRADPDVVADADPYTGAEVFTGGWSEEIGGTSLAAPLWAGMSALADRFASVNGRTRIGWAAPKIYTLANTAARYASDFHDINDGSSTEGSLSYRATAGWDQATGWGSIDWFKWVQDIVPATATTTTSTISSSLNPSTPGQAVTFTAQVTAASGTPSGTVSFRDNGTQIGTGALSSGTAIFSTGSLTAGTHPLTAVYLGASGFATSTSGTLSQVVNGSTATITTLSSSLNPSMPGQAVTFTTRVTGTGGTPSGTVSFRDNGTQIGTGTLSNGTATFSTGSLTAGTHPLTAVYLGASGFAASTSTAVNQQVIGAIVVRGHTIAATHGAALSGVLVGSIADGKPGMAARNYTATIDWGDGTATSAGVATGSSPTFTITGSHTYTAAGMFSINVTISVDDGRTAYLASIAQIS
jgi:subtilase family serine protease